MHLCPYDRFVFLDTDTYVGFSGGDVMPLVPNSRFKIFDSY